MQSPGINALLLVQSTCMTESVVQKVLTTKLLEQIFLSSNRQTLVFFHQNDS